MLEVRLAAPPVGRLISTDFPLVEGTSLIDMVLPLSEGKVEWDYVFPIRGEYRLHIRLIDGVGQGTRNALQLSIGESRRKWLYLASFTTALFFLGFVAGRLFTRSSDQTSGMTHLGILILVAALFPGGFTRVSAASPSEDGYLAELNIDQPTVGEPAGIRWKLYDGATGASKFARLTLSITHLEKGTPVFSLAKIPVNGEFSLDFHFTDGTEYQIVALGETEEGFSIRREQIVSVNPVEPPAQTSISVVVMFLSLIGLGLLTGRWSVGRSALKRKNITY